MNASFLLIWCLTGPVVVDQPQESIAIVDLRKCLRHVPSSTSDRDGLAHSITVTVADADAKNRQELLTKADTRSKREGATPLEVAKAKGLGPANY